MIQGVFGLPGMGKTTFLTKCAWLCLHGKSFMNIPPHPTVYTNFECPGCYELDFEQLGKQNFHDCLILIDEIMLFADCRDFKSFSPALKYFFALHRHFNVDILWCSQYYSDCDKKIRNLTNHFFLLEKSAVLPVSFVKPILRQMGAKDGQMVDTYTLGAPITWRFVWRPKYYNMFDSFDKKDLPPVDAPLWCPLPDHVSLWHRLTAWDQSPVLCILSRLSSKFPPLWHSLTAWDQSPVLCILSRLSSKFLPLRRSRPASAVADVSCAHDTKVE